MIFNSRRDSENCQERQIVDEATEWLLSLEDRDCEALRDGAEYEKRFLDWLERSPEHIRVFLEISHAYYALSAVDARDLAAAERPALHGGEKSSNVVSLRIPTHSGKPPADGWLQALGSVSKPASRRSKWLVAAALGAVAAGTCTWLSAGSFETQRPSRKMCATQIGERSIMQFEDGSAVYLNTASQMELQSDRHSLSGRLVSGEAFFRIPADSRPLHLSVDGLQIDSPAVQLDVRHDSAETYISVLEGKLRLSCDCAPHEVVLPAGYQLRVDRSSGLGRIQPQLITRHERDNLTGWRNGRLRFDGQSLVEAAKEFNRYNRRQLAIVDAGIAGLPIGGIFSANDVESFVAVLQKDFGVQARTGDTAGNDPNTVLLTRAAPPFSVATTP